MQLTIIDDTLCIRTHDRMIYAEQINTARISEYFIDCGYRPLTAQAIAYGILNSREQTILLAKLIKLLQN